MCFWRTLDTPLINCEVNLILTWSEDCVLTHMMAQAAVPAQEDNPARPAIIAAAGEIFKISDAKFHLPVVTLSTQNNNKLLRQLKTGLKQTIA